MYFRNGLNALAKERNSSPDQKSNLGLQANSLVAIMNEIPRPTVSQSFPAVLVNREVLPN